MSLCEGSSPCKDLQDTWSDPQRRIRQSHFTKSAMADPTVRTRISAPTASHSTREGGLHHRRDHGMAPRRYGSDRVHGGHRFRGTFFSQQRAEPARPEE
jgi:hypothetical protein